MSAILNACSQAYRRFFHPAPAAADSAPPVPSFNDPAYCDFNLRQKGAKLDHSTIYTFLCRQQKQGEPGSKYIVQKVDEDSLKKPFVLANQLKCGKGHPNKGLCLSVHRGGHFTALFVNIQQRRIVYYDPLGLSMPDTLQPFFRQIKHTLFPAQQPSSATEPRVRQIDFQKKHQCDDQTNCGRYVLHFLSTMVSQCNKQEEVQSTLNALYKAKISADTIYQTVVTWADQFPQSS